MVAPVVIFAIGNPSRGDDAIGPVLCGQLAEWMKNQGLSGQFELIEDFQLNIEHVLDLCGRELALFIDAGDSTPGPFHFSRIQPAEGIAHCTHELAPEAVLQVYRRTEKSEPPPSFVLCIRGESFELGEPLSTAAQANLELASACLQQLFQQADLVSWEALAEA